MGSNIESVSRQAHIQVKVFLTTYVWGPVSVSFHNHAQNFASFIDDYSRKVWIYFMKHKSNVFGIFKK